MSQLASSTFDGSDENPLSEGGNWTTTQYNLAMKRLANVATPSSIAADCTSLYTAVSAPNDQYSSGELSCAGTTTIDSGVGLCVRASIINTPTKWYRFVINHAGANNASIGCQGTAYRTLVNWTQAFTDTDRFTIAIVGMVITIYDKTNTAVMIFDDTGGAGAPTSGNYGVYSSTPYTIAGTTVNNWTGGGIFDEANITRSILSMRVPTVMIS